MSLRSLGIGAVVALLFAAGLWAGIGSAEWLGTDAKAIGLKATLNVAQEVPKPKRVRAKAGGVFTAGLVRQGRRGTLSWRLKFRRLTGKAAAAHVHIGKCGKAGPVGVTLCGPCRSGMRGTTRVSARTVTALLRGTAYVNVHTARNPAGEIRGQIAKGGKPVSPPATTTTTTTTTPTYTDPPPYP